MEFALSTPSEDLMLNEGRKSQRENDISSLTDAEADGKAKENDMIDRVFQPSSKQNPHFTTKTPEEVRSLYHPAASAVTSAGADAAADRAQGDIVGQDTCNSIDEAHGDTEAKVSAEEAEEAWEVEMFGETSTTGSRLGISYMRAQLTQTEVCLGPGGRCASVTVKQDIEDRESISGVVWDAGLLLSDFIVDEVTKELQQHGGQKPPHRCILDLGCGTGIVGVVAFAMYTDVQVFFSDLPSVRSIVEANLASATDAASPFEYLPFDWCSEDAPPSALLCPGGSSDASSTGTDTWHTVFCSDLLYDEKMHAPLLKLLRDMRFDRCIFGFKRRHPAAELEFFKQLRTWCDVQVLHMEATSLVNCTAAMAKAGGGLFTVLVTRKEVETDEANTL